MSENPQLPKDLTLEVVTPEGLLLREQVDEVIAPGDEMKMKPWVIIIAPVRASICGRSSSSRPASKAA